MGASIGGMGAAGSGAQMPDDMINTQFRDLYSQGYSGGQLGAEAIKRGIGQADFARATGLPADIVAQAYGGASAYQNNPAPAQPLPQQVAPPAPVQPVAAPVQSQPANNSINEQFRDMYAKGFSGGQLGAEAIRRGISQEDFVRATGLPADAVAQAYSGAVNYQNSMGKPDRDIDGRPGVDVPQQSMQQVSTQNRQFDPYNNNPFANTTNPYFQAAQQNAAGNLAGAQMATAANRVNQTTPYQSLQFTQSGVDAQGNPIWNANQQLAPGFQQSLGNIQQNVQQATARPFDVSATQNRQFAGQSPEFQRMGEAPALQSSVEGAGMAGWDRANELLMSRLRPQMEQRNAALDARLANQGIMPGTEAYNRAKLTASQADNDLMNQAQLAGQQVQTAQFNQNLQGGQFRNQALAAQNQMGLANAGFNNAAGQQGFTNQLAGAQFNNLANQNNFQQNLSAYNNPLQQLSAFQQGTNPSYANVANQQGVAGPDYFGALTTSNAADIAAQNARNAQTANMQAGLFGLGSSALLGGGGIGGLANTIGSGVNWLTGLGGGSSADYMKSIGAVSSGAFDPAMQSADYLNNLYSGLDIF